MTENVSPPSSVELPPLSRDAVSFRFPHYLPTPLPPPVPVYTTTNVQLTTETVPHRRIRREVGNSAEEGGGQLLFCLLFRKGMESGLEAVLPDLAQLRENGASGPPSRALSKCLRALREKPKIWRIKRILKFYRYYIEI